MNATHHSCVSCLLAQVVLMSSILFLCLVDGFLDQNSLHLKCESFSKRKKSYLGPKYSLDKNKNEELGSQFNVLQLTTAYNSPSIQANSIGRWHYGRQWQTMDIMIRDPSHRPNHHAKPRLYFFSVIDIVDKKSQFSCTKRS